MRTSSDLAFSVAAATLLLTASAAGQTLPDAPLANAAPTDAPVADPNTPVVDPNAPADPSAALPTQAPAAADAPAAPPIVVATAGDGVIHAPPEGQGQIVFFRPSRLGGAALSFSVREGDTGIGRLNNGRYFVHVTAPGIHEYNISSEATDTLRLEIEPGETYFVEQVINMGIMVGRPALNPSDQATFEERPLRQSTTPGVDRRRRGDD